MNLLSCWTRSDQTWTWIDSVNNSALLVFVYLYCCRFLSDFYYRCNLLSIVE